MKFAVFPKLVLLVLLAGAAALTGCGFLKQSPSSGSVPTAGNWSFVATSSVVSGQVSHIGGNLTVSGNSVSSTMHSDLPCFDVSQPLTLSGMLQKNQITFTSPANANNQVITLIASVTSSSAIAGTYTVTAGGGCAADQGNVNAALVPSMTGAWTGSVAGKGGPSAVLSMALTQAAAASGDGTYALTGNLTFANSSCSKSGTINNSFVAGSVVIIKGSTLEQDNITQGSFTFTNAFLNNPGAPTSMSGDYQVVSGYCATTSADTTTFTKQ